MRVTNLRGIVKRYECFVKANLYFAGAGEQTFLARARILMSMMTMEFPNQSDFDFASKCVPCRRQICVFNFKYVYTSIAIDFLVQSLELQ